MKTRVKFCGIRLEADALAAAALGVDAIGLVFDPASKRFIELPQAVMIRRRLPPFMTVVALFRNASAAYVKETMQALAPALAQFHGEETPAFCEGFGLPYLRAVPMKHAVDLVAVAKAHPNASGLLLDAHAPGEPGGQGKVFDWRPLPPRLPLRVVLAGGLTAENVGEAIAKVKPYAVDVSSGIEARPGEKDQDRMSRFMEAVKNADGR